MTPARFVAAALNVLDRAAAVALREFPLWTLDGAR